MASYSISTARKEDRTLYGIRITQRDGTTGWIVGADGDGLFFEDKGKARQKLNSLQSDDRYSWNCDAEVAEFTGWKG